MALSQQVFQPAVFLLQGAQFLYVGRIELPVALAHWYNVCSLIPCFLATCATMALSIARRILTF